MTSTYTIVAKKSGVSSYLTTKYIYIYIQTIELYINILFLLFPGTIDLTMLCVYSQRSPNYMIFSLTLLLAIKCTIGAIMK